MSFEQRSTNSDGHASTSNEESTLTVPTINYDVRPQSVAKNDRRSSYGNVTAKDDRKISYAANNDRRPSFIPKLSLARSSITTITGKRFSKHPYRALFCLDEKNPIRRFAKFIAESKYPFILV